MRSRFFRWLVLLAAFLAPLQAASAADFSVQSRALPGPVAKATFHLTTIRLTGVIEQGDSAKLRRILTRLKTQDRGAAPDQPMATAELSSLGGDVLEGMKIGTLLREFMVPTVVRRGDQCLSACAFAFLGGTEPNAASGYRVSRSLEPGADLAFHNISLNREGLRSATSEAAVVESFNVARHGVSAIVKYGNDMGVPAAFVANLLAQRSEQLLYVSTAGDLADLEVCPTEYVGPELTGERQAVNICNNGMNWSHAAAAGQVRSMMANDVRLHLLTHVHRNLETLDVAQRYAAQLKAIIESRDRTLVVSTYAALRSSGVPLPELGASSFVVNGYTAGPYRMECVVSLSGGELGMFDLVVTGPKGFAPPVRRGPARCPWLYLYDRRDVVSPPRS